ncbi:hypothetical protein VIGAN_08249000 [Vigna angularis var. angularis]|uniref:Uncharacterized protein n=1 Tax=Vigna angularis var. angularis TaxID=157739 RepID=A0A0S3SS98_PHAAN|nr:hypothetical protein VIGAN_08249000 [Vigna angularis var. angularis]
MNQHFTLLLGGSSPIMKHFFQQNKEKKLNHSSITLPCTYTYIFHFFLFHYNLSWHHFYSCFLLQSQSRSLPQP